MKLIFSQRKQIYCQVHFIYTLTNINYNSLRTQDGGGIWLCVPHSCELAGGGGAIAQFGSWNWLVDKSYTTLDKVRSWPDISLIITNDCTPFGIRTYYRTLYLYCWISGKVLYLSSKMFFQLKVRNLDTIELFSISAQYYSILIKFEWFSLPFAIHYRTPQYIVGHLNTLSDTHIYIVGHCLFSL